VNDSSHSDVKIAIQNLKSLNQHMWYNGYYTSLPTMKTEFDSRHVYSLPPHLGFSTNDLTFSLSLLRLAPLLTPQSCTLRTMAGRHAL